jgi:FtsZ-interacting cell division protein ZipA
MDPFRLLLIVVGLILVVAIYVASRRSPGDSLSTRSALTRRHTIPLSGDVAAPERPYQGNPESGRTLPIARKRRKRYVNYMRGSNAATASQQSFYNLNTEPEPLSVTVFVLPLTGTTFKRDQVINCLKSLGCMPRGHQGYDYVILDDEQANRVNRLFTVKDVHDAGIFAGNGQAANSTNSLAFEMQLPGPMDSVMAFEKLLEVARLVATKLNGVVCDDLQNRLTRQTTLHIKDKIVDYNRRLRFTQSSSIQ